MKKISLFSLMFLGVFMLFAQEAASESAQESVNADAAQPSEAPQEQAQPAETDPNASQEAVQPEAATVEASVKEEPQEEVKEEPAAVEESKEEPEVVASEESAGEELQSGNSQKVEYYRPYLGAGVPLIVIGSVSFLIMMPAMGTMAFAASDACEGKDWDFCEELHDNNKKHHTAWTVGSVMTGVVGAGMIAVGSWLTTIEKPRKNQSVQLNSVAVLPKKNGMFASIGFKF